MADHEIKTKLKLEGESEYSAALKQSYQNLRVLNSELKREESALKSNATEQEKSKVKADALRKKIEEQKKIVETLRKALEQSKKQFGDSSAETAKWEIKLNNATAALNTMNNQLEGLDGGLGNANTSLGESAQQTANLASAFQQMGTMAKSIGDTISGVADTMVSNIKTAVNEIVNLMGVAMASVGQWKGITEIYGGKEEDVQKFFYGLNSVGLGTGSVASTIQALVKRTHNGSNAKALKGLGIDEDQFGSHWDYYYSVLQKLAAPGMTDSARYSAIEDIFGSGQTDEVMAMMAKWDDMFGNRTDVENSGGFLSQSVIEEVAKAQDELDKLKADWTTFQTFLGSELIVKLNYGGIINDTDNILKNLMEFMSATDEEGRMTALVKLEGNVTLLTDDISTALTNLSSWLDTLGEVLQNSDSGLLQTLGSVLDMISTALDWINDPKNAQTIQTFMDWFIKNKLVEIMTGKSIPEWITTIITTLSGIATTVTLIGLKNGVSSAEAGLANTANTAGWLSALGNTVGGIAALPAGLSAYLYGLVQVGKYGNEHPENSAENAEYVTSGLSSGDPLIDALRKVAYEYSDYTAKEDLDFAGEFDGDIIAEWQEYQAALDALKGFDGGEQVWDKFIRWKAYNPSGDMTGFIDETFGELQTAVDDIVDDLIEWEEILGVEPNYGQTPTVNPVSTQPLNLTVVTTLDGQKVAENQFPYINRMLADDQ